MHLVRIGGLPPLMKVLLDAGLIHGDCLTVTGRTVAENLRGSGRIPPTRTWCARFSNPIKADSHLRILRGNLAPGGAVAKISGKEGLEFAGRAIVFESEETALRAILGGRVKEGHVIVIRNEGPVGGPGMREMLAPDQRRHGQGPGQVRRPDHRRALLRRQPRLRRRPHHPRGRRRAVRSPSSGTAIRSRSTPSRTRSPSTFPPKEIKARLKEWKPKAPKETRGALAKYARLVTSASEGAVTDKLPLVDHQTL